MQSGELFVMTTGIFRMPGWSVVNWDIQMLWLLHCLHTMVKGLDQFCLTIYNVLELNWISLHVHTIEMVTTAVNTIKMLQLNVQVC